jgi:hypothetical protein
VHRNFKTLLHQYKLEVFHNEHDKKSAEEIATECLHLTEDVLKQKYHFHFHSLPSADRAEVISMINNYVRDAILPPVIEKLVKRQVILEKRITAMQHLMEKVLEVLSTEVSSSAESKR